MLRFKASMTVLTVGNASQTFGKVLNVVLFLKHTTESGNKNQPTAPKSAVILDAACLILFTRFYGYH